MRVLLVTALVLLVPGGGPTYKGEVRKPHPLAPSLPELTEKEQQALAEVVDRFIQQDIGKLKGDAGKKAVAEFKALGPEAVFALLEGLNRAANMEDSCPAVLIAKKIGLIINATKDMELLDFLRENIGADVTAKRHANVLKDLKLAALLRKSALQRAEIASNKKGGGANTKEKEKDKTPAMMTVAELAAAANKETGAALKNTLTELATRKGDQVVQTLGIATGKGDKEMQQLAMALLVEVLSKQTPDELKAWLKKGSTAVRTAAAQAIGDKGYLLINELITALNDAEEAVRQAARAALVKLAGDMIDHGPQIGAAPTQRTEAQERWRAWWQKKN
jgi:hypothetical protein